MDDLFNLLQHDYLEAMHQGSGRRADQVIDRALSLKVTANEIYLHIFQNTAYEIGRLWQRNRFSVAQEHLATAIIERQMGDLHPYFKPVQERKSKIVLGTVDNEQHRVGLRMVADFFEQDGWDVYYLGASVPTRTFISIAREFQADIIGVSAQMVYHLTEVMNFIKEVDRQGLGGMPVMAGGYPFVQNPGLYQSLGIQFSGANALEAVKAANEIVRIKR